MDATAPARRSRARVRRSLPALLLTLAVVAAACSGADDDDGEAVAGSPSASTTVTTAADRDAGQELDGEAWPTEEWAAVDAGAAGLDAAALERLADRARRADSDCLVVTKDGRLVGEWYWGDFDEDSRREAFSVTKSITSTLVGIAQDRGLLDIDQPAADFIEEWRGTPSERVTVRDLLSNDSGRFQDFETDYVQMAAQAADKTAFSIGLSQQHEPGTTWVYNNAAIQTLEAVLEEATGMPVHDFADEVLFEPTGMGSRMTTDAAGNTLTFMGAQASCRDLARFGLLHLRGGGWAGEQVVSEEWVTQALTPSTELNPSYGFLWWLNRPGRTEQAGDVPPRLAPAGPEDLYAALGLYNQVVAVFPSSGVVATRLGGRAGEDGTQLGLDDLAAGVQEALGQPVEADARRVDDAATDPPG